MVDSGCHGLFIYLFIYLFIHYFLCQMASLQCLRSLEKIGEFEK